MTSALTPPSANHWFGADEYGRDMLGRPSYGTQATLLALVDGLAPAQSHLDASLRAGRMELATIGDIWPTSPPRLLGGGWPPPVVRCDRHLGERGVSATAAPDRRSQVNAQRRAAEHDAAAVPTRRSFPRINLSISLGPMVRFEVQGETCTEIADALDGFERLNRVVDAMFSDLAERVYPGGDIPAQGGHEAAT